MSAWMAYIKLAIAMLAALPLTGRNVEPDLSKSNPVEFSSAKTSRPLVSTNDGHLPLQDVPRQAWLSIDRLTR